MSAPAWRTRDRPQVGDTYTLDSSINKHHINETSNNINQGEPAKRGVANHFPPFVLVFPPIYNDLP